MEKSKMILQLFHRNKLVGVYKFNDKESLIVGRQGKSVDIPISDNIISRKHAEFQWREDTLQIKDCKSLNGTYINRSRIFEEAIPLKRDDLVQFGENFTYSIKIKTVGEQKDQTAIQRKKKTLSQLIKQFPEVTIGRKGFGAILQLEDQHNYISRTHAIVSKVGQKYFIKDLDSTNGTTVNGKRIPPNELIQITSKDIIFIGLHVLKLNEQTRYLIQEPSIQVKNVSKTFITNSFLQKKSTKKALHELSFEIIHQEFIALMGPSGCGKSTLLKILNNYHEPTTGKVFIHGYDLQTNFHLLKRKIGYVPQEDILHRDLTVQKTLFYAAKLRMGEKVSNLTINEKINEVLNNLNINEPWLRTSKIKNLSGGQRKRVSIAIELLNNPSILFLDEPTSPLDPETIKDFLGCLKKLTSKGTTIIMVTHKPADLNFVDKVIFLTTNGYPAYLGRAGESMLSHFKQKDIIDIYSELSNESKVLNYYKSWKDGEKEVNIKQTPDNITVEKESIFHQSKWLCKRYLNIKLNNESNMIVLLFQPVIIAFFLFLVFSTLQLGVLFLMAITALWFGVINSAKEIVQELPIYKRERMLNLRIGPYLLSKILVLSMIALIQVILFVLLIKFSFLGDEIELVYIVKYILFMFYLSVSATIMGLLISARFPNVEIVLTFVPILLIPQIMLSGVITNLDSNTKEILSYFTLGRWGTEGFALIQDGYPAYNFKKDIFETEVNDYSIDTIRSGRQIQVVESIFHPIFEPVDTNSYIKADTFLKPHLFKTNYDNKTGAIDLLGFYQKDRIKIFENWHLAGPITGISVLNIISIIVLFIWMKGKDSK